MPDTNEQIAPLSPQHRLFIPKEIPLEPNVFGLIHQVQVAAGDEWLVYCDGQLKKRLKPGRYTWWNGFRHDWRAQIINVRVELLPRSVKGRVKGPSMPKEAAGGTAIELACDVTAELEIACKIAQIENYLQYRDPITVFFASIDNMVVEFIGRLSYDQYGQWSTVIRDLTKERLQPGGRDDSVRRLGILVEDIFVTDFKPNTAHDRNVLSMYQLIERGKRELVEAQANSTRDTVVAESFAQQGGILNIAPSILAMQKSPIGKDLIDRDADLRRLIIATGLNPGVNVQPLQDVTGQLGSGQPASVGYLNPPQPAVTGQLQARPGQPNQVSGQLFSVDQSNPDQASTSPLFQDTGGPPVDNARQKIELAGLESAGFNVAGSGQVVSTFDASGRPVPATKEWVLQVSARRPTGYLTIAFHCPAGYPSLAPRVEVKPPTGGGFQQVEPNTVHEWNAGCMLADVAREIAENTP